MKLIQENWNKFVKTIKEEIQKEISQKELYDVESVILKLLLEGQAERVLEKYPEIQPAYDAGIRNPSYLRWLGKRRGDEPVEDIIGVLQTFEKKKSQIKSKGRSTDINTYKNPGELKQTLEKLGASGGEQRRKLKKQETTYLGEFGDWLVAMPHTTESSCQLGKGTTWCTAATQSQNLFLNYTGRKDVDVILYYIMKRGADPRQDPNAKLSVGFVGGKLKLTGQDGGVSVDAENKGLTENKLQQILGDQFQPIMTAMQQHAASIKGKHPAKKVMQQIAAGDLQRFNKYTKNLEEKEREDFIAQLLNYDVAAKLLIQLATDESNTVKIKRYVAENPNTPPEALANLATNEEWQVRSSVAENPNTPPEVLAQLVTGKNGGVERYVAANPNTPPATLAQLATYESDIVKINVAENPNTPTKTLAQLATDIDGDVRKAATTQLKKRKQAFQESLSKYIKTIIKEEFEKKNC